MENPLILQGHLLRSKVSFAGIGIAHIPAALFIPKNNNLTPADLAIFGCSKLSKTATYPVPDELKDIVSTTPICQTVSDNEGIFSFSRLAGGDYFLVVYHDPSLTPRFKSRLTISPAFLPVRMEHTDLYMTEGFHVTSFHFTGGRVQMASNFPIPGADILVDGVSVTKTDKEGAYALEISTPGVFKIDVRVARLRFDTAVINLEPSLDQLPLFKPSAIELCGQFKVATSSNFRDQDLPIVEFVTEGQLSGSVAASLSPDKSSARFCKYLTPGKHTIRLGKSSTGVRFTPTNVNVDLSAGPIKDVLFTQFQAKLTGEVLCSQTCPITSMASRLAVRLVSVDREPGDDTHHQVIHLIADPENAKRATFAIKSVFPSRYVLELVTVEADSEVVPASGWCWSEAGWRHPLEVIDKDLHYSITPSLHFEQSGHRIRVEAPLLGTGFGRPIDLTVTGSSSSPVDKKMEKAPELKLYYRLTHPVSDICLPQESEVFDFIAETTCVRLSPPKPNRVRPITDIPASFASPFTLQLNVREVIVEAVVEVSREFASLTKNTTLPQLIIEASVTPTGSQVAKSTKRIAANWQQQKMRTSLWVAPGDEVRLEVKPSEVASAKSDQVYPLILPTSTRVLHVPLNSPELSENYHADEVKATAVAPKTDINTTCSISLDAAFNSQLSASFTLKPGFFYTGSVVNPQPVSKALVSVFADPFLVSSTFDVDIDLSDFTSPEVAPAAGLTLVTHTLTNERGEFRVGPVYVEPMSGTKSPPTPASLLTLRLQKPGYEFTQLEEARPGSEWTFTARKLALVELKVLTEENTVLPNTLITIIGNAFRGSEATDANGIVRYIGLPSGEYYIQPILKEYDFVVRQGKTVTVPMEYALSVDDGGFLSVELVAKRVAYSAFGKVTSLSGVAEPDVLVEAKLVSETGGLKTYPETVPDNVGACRHIQDVNFPVPVEQATTDTSGRFKLLGLLPGCLYAVRVHSRLSGKDVEGDVFLRTVPGQIIVRASLEDVSGLHFFVTPQVIIGQISATVDTTDEHMLNLHLVVHPLNQPNTVIVRHKFATESRFFSISGKQMQPMLGNAYTILLETNFQLGSRDRNSTVQKYNFKVEKTGSNHYFKFAYRPHAVYTSVATRV